MHTVTKSNTDILSQPLQCQYVLNLLYCAHHVDICRRAKHSAKKLSSLPAIAVHT